MIMLTQPLAPWGFGYEPQNGNAGNWFVSQYIFTYLCSTSALSWTWYSLSVHFILLDIFLYFPWSITPRLRSFLDRCFWNSLARLTSFFGVQECIINCNFLLLNTSSWTSNINWYIYIALFNGIKTINHLFTMSRCTYNSINYNWVTLGKNGHKV